MNTWRCLKNTNICDCSSNRLPPSAYITNGLRVPNEVKGRPRSVNDKSTTLQLISVITNPRHVSTKRHITWSFYCKYLNKQQHGGNIHAFVFYSAGDRFDSWPEHRLYWGNSWFISVLLATCWNSISEHFPSKSFQTYSPINLPFDAICQGQHNMASKPHAAHVSSSAHAIACENKSKFRINIALEQTTIAPIEFPS